MSLEVITERKSLPTMFDQLIAFANESSLISEWLPPLIKVGAMTLIGMIALMPIMLVSWVVLWASAPAVARARAKIAIGIAVMSKQSADFLRKGLEASKQLASQKSYVSLEEVEHIARPPELEALDQSIQSLRARLEEAPEIARNCEQEKKSTLERLTVAVETLSKARDLVRTPHIPRVAAQDATAKLKKREALTALLVFTPLTLVAIVINTALLNVFFEELFVNKDALGVPYSIIISFVFSVIEVGVGVVLGFLATRDLHDSGSSVTKAICWLVILCLILIETALYFLVGTQSIGRLRDDEVSLMIANGEIVSLFLMGAWFTLIGPAIVLSLYLFGHKLAEAYFKFTRFTSFEQFQKSMDEGYEISQKFLADVKDGESTVDELLKRLKEYDFVLNNNEHELPHKVSEYSSVLSAEVNAVNQSIESARTIDLQPSKAVIHEVGAQQTSNILRISSVFFLLLILAVTIGAWTFSIETLPFITNQTGGPIVLSIFVSLVSLSAGYMLTPKATLVAATEAGPTSVLIEKRSVTMILSVALGSMGLAVFYWFVFADATFPGLRASLAVALNVACFFVGTKLMANFTAWLSIGAIIGNNIMAIACRFLSWALSGLSAILELFLALLGVFAAPVKRLFVKSTSGTDGL
jgi:hypothetical protein